MIVITMYAANYNLQLINKADNFNAVGFSQNF